ncbi:MAG: hypothetical protein KKH01_07410 [Firmicutes bacterium]|nr:hypothetical protein [Bacillota bacterium]
MIKFVKGFKDLFPESIQSIILVLLSVFAIIVSVWNQVRIFDFIINFLPITLIAAGVLILQSKKQSFFAHAMLFFLFYSDQLGGFIRSILSYNFGNVSLSIPLTLTLILCMVGGVYLILYLASHILSGNLKFNFKYKKSVVLLPLIAMVLYAYFRNSFLTVIVWSLPVVVSLLLNAPLAALMFLIRCFITVPILFLDTLINGSFKFTTVSYWIFFVAALYILTISIIATLNILNEPKVK